MIGCEVNNSFLIDTAVSYGIMYSVDTILRLVQEENIRLLTMQKSLDMSGTDIKLLKSNRIPTIGLSGKIQLVNATEN